MRYFIIAGEASGDLHASHLVTAIRKEDAEAQFQGLGGDLMAAAGVEVLWHYRTMAYMGFVQVVLHLPQILRAMRACKAAMEVYRPDAIILVDYPGFNLNIAAWARKHLEAPIFYYIAPKIWAWKEGRIRKIRRNVDKVLSILPFEVDYFERKHGYHVDYVGNPSRAEVDEFLQHDSHSFADFCAAHQLDPQRKIVALLAGSRRSEIAANLPRMLQAFAQVQTKSAARSRGTVFCTDRVICSYYCRTRCPPARISSRHCRSSWYSTRGVCALFAGPSSCASCLFRYFRAVEARACSIGH